MFVGRVKIVSYSTGRNTIRVSCRLDSDQDLHSVSPDLSPNCFAKVTSRRQKLPLARKELDIILYIYQGF